MEQQQQKIFHPSEYRQWHNVYKLPKCTNNLPGHSK